MGDLALCPWRCSLGGRGRRRPVQGKEIEEPQAILMTINTMLLACWNDFAALKEVHKISLTIACLNGPYQRIDQSSSTWIQPSDKKIMLHTYLI